MRLSRSPRVLHALQSSLSFMKIYNTENFHGKPSATFYNVFKMLGITVFMLIIPVTLAFDFWFCVNRKFDLDLTALPISVLLYCSQVYFVYISFVMKNGSINLALIRVQKIITRRK